MRTLCHLRFTALVAVLSLLFLITNNSLLAQGSFPVFDETGLLLSYDFNKNFEEQSGTLPDAIPYMVNLDEGQFCQEQSAAAFSQEGSLIKFPDVPAFQAGSPFTITFMLYLNEYPQEEYRILSMSDSSDLSMASFWVSLFPEGQSKYDIPWSFSYINTDGVTVKNTSEFGVMKGGWISHTITYDGSVLIMYMGSEPTLIAEIGGLQMVNDNFPLWFGNLYADEFRGKLDYLRLFDRALAHAEIEDIVMQYMFWKDQESVEISATPGEDIELISKVRGSYLNYTFKKDGQVLQEGSDSILVINAIQISDFGSYTCIIDNCNQSQEMTFLVELACPPSNLQIMSQSNDLYVYENSEAEFTLEVTGASSSTSYNWFLNGTPQDHLNRASYLIHLVSSSDTGYYYCQILDQCDTFYSDSIYLGLLARDEYPYIEQSDLKIYYGFNGNFTDSTFNTGPALATNVQFDSGMFANPGASVFFDGEDSFLEIQDDPDIDMDEMFSLLLIVKIDSLPDKIAPILAKSGTENDSIGNFGLFVDPDGHLIFGVHDSGGIEYKNVSAAVLEKGRWHIVMAAYDGVSIRVSIDGNVSEPTTLENSVLRTDDNSLKIGNDAFHDICFSIDELRLGNHMEDQEFDMFRSLFGPSLGKSKGREKVCPPCEVAFPAMVYGPYLKFKFFRDDIVFQEGENDTCVLVVETEEDFGTYFCEISNSYDTLIVPLILEIGTLYDDLYIYHSNDEVEFYSEGDDVKVRFFVNNYYDGVEYEMYHNGVLMPDVYRGLLTIENAGPEAIGEYYFVVVNGCERLISDTVTLVMSGMDFLTYEVPGWDWTSNISGTGDSYFSSICEGKLDGSYCMLGHFSGGLRIEDTEAFSSQSDDVFIVKYGVHGGFQWARFHTGTDFKGKGDVAMDLKGNVYVSGSFRGSVQIEGETLVTQENAGCAYLMKYDKHGDKEWLKVLESTGTVSCSNIEIGADGQIYLGGNFEGALTIGEKNVSGDWDRYANVMFVAGFDTEGNCKWVNHAVTDPDWLMGFGLIGMDISLSGELIAAGTCTSSIDFGNDVLLNAMGESPFLVKYNSEGQAQWAKSFGSEKGFAETFDVSVDDLDRIFVTGMYLNDMTCGDQTIGYTDDLMEEIFIARFDSEGICTKLNSYGSTGEGGDFGMCYEPVSDSSGYLLGLYGDELIMGDDTLIAQDLGGVGISPNMFISLLSDDGVPKSLQSAGVRGRRHSGEIMVTEDGKVFFAGLSEVSRMKKSVAETNISIAFAGFRYEISDTTTVVDTTSGPDVIFNGGHRVEDNCFIYPNPASNEVYVSSKDQILFDLWIYSIQGKILGEYSNKAKYRVDLSAFPSGVYLLKMRMGSELLVSKLVVR